MEIDDNNKSTMTTTTTTSNNEDEQLLQQYNTSCHNKSNDKIIYENFSLYVLFYCWNDQGDHTKYSLTLHGVADIVREHDEYGSKQIENWRLPYLPPTMEIFRNYDLETVNRWYKVTYELPDVLIRNLIARVTNQEMLELCLMDVPPYPIVLNTTYMKLYTQTMCTISSSTSNPSNPSAASSFVPCWIALS